MRQPRDTKVCCSMQEASPLSFEQPKVSKTSLGLWGYLIVLPFCQGGTCYPSVTIVALGQWAREQDAAVYIAELDRSKEGWRGVTFE